MKNLKLTLTIVALVVVTAIVFFDADEYVVDIFSEFYISDTSSHSDHKKQSSFGSSSENNLSSSNSRRDTTIFSDILDFSTGSKGEKTTSIDDAIKDLDNEASYEQEVAVGDNRILTPEAIVYAKRAEILKRANEMIEKQNKLAEDFRHDLASRQLTEHDVLPEKFRGHATLCNSGEDAPKVWRICCRPNC